MENLKNSELSKALGISMAYINVNIKRGKIVIGSDGRINLQDKTNKQFIDYQIANGKTFDINNIYIKNDKSKLDKSNNDKSKTKQIQTNVEIKSTTIKPKQNKKEQNNNSTDTDQINKFQNLAEQKFKLEVNKLRLDCELKELQKYKIEGSLIPVDAAKNIFLWSIDTFHQTYCQEVQTLANVYVQILGADSKKFANIIKELNQSLIKIKEDAKQNLLIGVAGIVEEYQEVRGRGEKK